MFIDGKYVGPAANFKIARIYELSPGEHEVRLAEPRYEEIVTKVTITAGKKTVLKEQMKAPKKRNPISTPHARATACRHRLGGLLKYYEWAASVF